MFHGLGVKLVKVGVLLRSNMSSKSSVLVNISPFVAREVTEN